MLHVAAGFKVVSLNLKMKRWLSSLFDQSIYNFGGNRSTLKQHQLTPSQKHFSHMPWARQWAVDLFLVLLYSLVILRIQSIALDRQLPVMYSFIFACRCWMTSYHICVLYDTSICYCIAKILKVPIPIIIPHMNILDPGWSRTIE